MYQIDLLFSLIEIPSFSLGLSQEDVGRIPNIQPQMRNDDFGETRKSKRTRIPPSILNDYQCDPKIKVFRAEDIGPSNDRNVTQNIDEVYLSMREGAGQNK